MSQDFLSNIYAELFGVFISIPLSVAIAFVLDRMTEQRNFLRSLRATLLTNQRVREDFWKYINTLATQTKEDWEIELGLRRSSRERAEKLRLLVQNIQINYAHKLSDEETTLFENELIIAQQMEAAFSLNSDWFHQSRRNNKPAQEIVSKQVDCALNIFDQSAQSTQYFRRQFPHLKITPDTEISRDQLQLALAAVFKIAVPYRLERWEKERV